MTNREKYKDNILDIALSGNTVAVDSITRIPIACNRMYCKDCLRGMGCSNDKLVDWANSEYMENPSYWKEVKVDTPILVRNSESDNWTRRYFAKYDNGEVYAWNSGITSWTAGNYSDPDDKMTHWRYAAELYKG